MRVLLLLALVLAVPFIAKAIPLNPYATWDPVQEHPVYYGTLGQGEHATRMRWYPGFACAESPQYVMAKATLLHGAPEDVVGIRLYGPEARTADAAVAGPATVWGWTTNCLVFGVEGVTVETQAIFRVDVTFPCGRQWDAGCIEAHEQAWEA